MTAAAEARRLAIVAEVRRLAVGAAVFWLCAAVVVAGLHWLAAGWP